MLRWLQLFQPRPPAFNRASHSRLRFSLSVINSTSSTDPLTREDNCVSQIAFFGPGCRGFGLIGAQPCSSSNRRQSSIGIVRASASIGAGRAVMWADLTLHGRSENSSGKRAFLILPGGHPECTANFSNWALTYPNQRSPSTWSDLASRLARVGGLHHRYERRAA